MAAAPASALAAPGSARRGAAHPQPAAYLIAGRNNRYVSLGLPDVFVLCPEPVLTNDCFSEEETSATKRRFSRTKIAVFRGADGAIPRRVSNASDAPAKNASRSLNLSSYVCPKPVLVKWSYLV
eukprot:COSAG06_NODE_5098_length_3717_cov_15.451907_3_plen_124_part_00